MKRGPLLLALLLTAGCTHTRYVDTEGPSPQWQARMTAQGRQQRATVLLRSGFQHAARGLRVTTDSVFWHGSQLKPERGIAAREVVEVRFTDRSRGALSGLIIGAVTLGTLSAALAADINMDPDERATFAGGLAIGGAFWGAIIGSRRRHEVVYRFAARPRRE